jgi:hypothetical protein
MATAEAQARWRERKRQRDQGKTEVRGIYARPDLHKQLRAIAAQMEDKQMAKRQEDRVFHRIQMARNMVRLAAEYPETHDEAKLRELIVEANYALTQLMAFRNIINGMVGFECEPKDAVLPYLDLEAAE